LSDDELDNSTRVGFGILATAAASNALLGIDEQAPPAAQRAFNLLLDRTGTEHRPHELNYSSVGLNLLSSTMRTIQKPWRRMT